MYELGIELFKQSDLRLAVKVYNDVSAKYDVHGGLDPEFIAIVEIKALENDTFSQLGNDAEKTFLGTFAPHQVFSLQFGRDRLHRFFGINALLSNGQYFFGYVRCKYRKIV